MPTVIGNGLGNCFGGSAPFDPSSIKVDGEKVLQQQLLTKQAPTITGVITDESKNKGDARPEQLRQFRNLNGSTQYGVVDDNTDFDITNNLSVVTWAKNDNAIISTINTLAGKYQASGDKREWYFGINTSEQLVIAFGSSTGAFQGSWRTSSAVAIENINTCGFTFQSGTVKIYVNGVEVASGLGGGTIPSVIYNNDSNKSRVQTNTDIRRSRPQSR